MNIQPKNVAAWLLSAAPMAYPWILDHLSASSAYWITLVAVFAFHLTGQWLAAVNPSIKQKANVDSVVTATGGAS